MKPVNCLDESSLYLYELKPEPLETILNGKKLRFRRMEFDYTDKNNAPKHVWIEKIQNGFTVWKTDVGTTFYKTSKEVTEALKEVHLEAV